MDLIPEKFHWFPPEEFAGTVVTITNAPTVKKCHELGFRGSSEDYVDTAKLPGAKALTGFTDFTATAQVSVTGGPNMSVLFAVRANILPQEERSRGGLFSPRVVARASCSPSTTEMN